MGSQMNFWINRASSVKEAMSFEFPHELEQGQNCILNVIDNVLVCESEVNHKQSDCVILTPLLDSSWDSDLSILD